MIRSFYLSTILLCMLFSCREKTAPPPKSYTDQQEKYSMVFHEEPQKSTEIADYPFGKVNWSLRTINKADDLNLSYLFKYADLPPEVIHSDSLRLLADFFLFTQRDLLPVLGDQEAGKINVIEIQKYPGREFIWVDSAKNTGYTRRVYLVKNRVYFLEVKYLMEHANNEKIASFFEQFTLLNTEENKVAPAPLEAAEPTLKKYGAVFPGPTRIVENTSVDPLMGRVQVITEAYEVPKQEMNQPATSNIAFAVNYTKLSAARLKELSQEQLQNFVKKAFSDNIKTGKGDILYMKEGTFYGHWGIEGQGVIFQGQAVMHLKAFIAGQYYYQVMVLSRRGEENNAEAQAFFNSFRLQGEENL